MNLLSWASGMEKKADLLGWGIPLLAAGTAGVLGKKYLENKWDKRIEGLSSIRRGVIEEMGKMVKTPNWSEDDLHILRGKGESLQNNIVNLLKLKNKQVPLQAASLALGAGAGTAGLMALLRRKKKKDEEEEEA